MLHDPLRALMRGCRRAPKQPAPKQPAPEQPAPEQPAPERAAPAAPPPAPTFAELLPDARIQSALHALQVRAPTAIQAAVIPHFHTNDVLAVAPTGSGKTLCYVLPLLTHHLQLAQRQQPPRCHSVILAPTHELVNQIARVLERVLKLTHTRAHVRALNSKQALAAWNSAPNAVNFVIATPQRLVAAAQLLKSSSSTPDFIVLDEADELLSDKFLPQVDDALHVCGVVNKANNHKHGSQRMHMFSATMAPAVAHLARCLMNDMKRVTVGASAYGGSFAVDEAVKHIEQRFVFVGGRAEQGKVMAVRNLLRNGVQAPVLLFVQSKERAAQLFRELLYDGVHVDAIHSDRTVAARETAVQRFREGNTWVLIATDVLSRGLDFLAVRTVINYDVPSSAAAYVHRIGRCGRNGRHGVALSLFTEEDLKLIGAVVRVARASGALVPEWLLRAGGRVRADEVRRLERRPPKRAAVGGPNMASVGGGRRKRRRVQPQSQQQPRGGARGGTEARAHD
ncbi:putative ATP-dependent RNA helicase ddx52 [Gracilariopsis chorda]|uniref:RNA helicase n=1 Tax=Gracilariopsis chorda TaxID=448386 RepID=A0A2V3ILG7_9FLOR|nr:putative ATP-dependent RNA helicase ddx52 [Gracilariopsis chorda]|eukprot:PXF42925.1 putative ATP-dependent RNA helicase ddx52 [Gracilariopsis chorda]